MSGILFELRFQPFEQREGVGGRAGETADEAMPAGYRTLLVRSADTRRRLFSDLASASPGNGTYLARWRRSAIGCLKRDSTT